MGYRALTQVMRGSAPPVEPGEEIPARYSDHLGGEFDVDFERLVELGAAEEVKAKRKGAKADTDSDEQQE